MTRLLILDPAPATDAFSAPDLLNYADPAMYLRDLLRQKQTKNPRFSFRSFAKTLVIPPSTLNAILNGTRKISPSHSVSISSKLGLSSLEQTYFQLLVVLEASRGTAAEASLRQRADETGWLIRASRREGLSQLDFVPEWYHLAIAVWADRDGGTAERTELEAFGRRLGLTPEGARAAIDVLLEKEILALKDGTHLVRTTNRIFITSNERDAGIRKLHRTLLEKAGEALEEQSPAMRYSATEFVTLDEEGFAKFRKLTDQYLDQIHYEAKQISRPDRLYSVSLHSFPLPARGSS